MPAAFDQAGIEHIGMRVSVRRSVEADDIAQGQRSHDFDELHSVLGQPAFTAG